MPPLFVFGTLMDPDLLTLVLGRALDPAGVVPARLRGWRRVHVAGRPYPMVVPHPGGRVEGLLLHGLGPVDLDRLAYYEGWEYRLAPQAVLDAVGRPVAARLYRAIGPVRADPRPWRLDRWRALHKPVALARLRRLMEAYVPGAGAGGDGRARPLFSPGADRRRRARAAERNG